MAQTTELTAAGIPLRRAGGLRTSALGRLLRIKLAVFGLTILTITVLAAALGPPLAPYGPTEFAGESAEQPFTTSRILGTYILGRDQFTRLLYGARASLQVAFTAVAIGLSVGSAVGLSAAYFKGVVDSVSMRIVDAMLWLIVFMIILLGTEFLLLLPSERRALRWRRPGKETFT